MTIMVLTQNAYSMFAEIVYKLGRGLSIDAPDEPLGNDIMCWWSDYASLIGYGLIREASNGAYPSFIELTPEGVRHADIHFPDRSNPLK